MCKEYKHMVCTLCRTYNHANYIEDAMNGFTMQETSFPVVTVIIDDASTDGEQDVIRKYLDEHFQEPYRTEETDYAHIVCANHRTNPNCQFVVLFLKYNHYSLKKSTLSYLIKWQNNAKYTALCEGDDYWIYKHKLQKQIDFLEDHVEFVMCCHESLHFYQNSGRVNYRQHKILKHNPNGFSFDINHYPWITDTLSLVYRTNYKYKSEYEKMKNRLDISFIYYIKKSGKCHLMPDIMSVYRIHNGGICSGVSLQNRHKQYMDIYSELVSLEKDKQVYRYFRLYFLGIVTQLILLGEWKIIYKSLKKYFSLTNTFNKFITIPMIGLKCIPEIINYYAEIVYVKTFQKL